MWRVRAASSTAGIAAVAALGVGTAVLAYVAMRTPAEPPAGSSGVPSPSATPTAEVPAETRSVRFLGDDHLASWFADAADRVGLEPVEPPAEGAGFFSDTTLSSLVTGEAPSVLVLSAGTQDVVWADDFQLGLEQTLDTIAEQWPDTQVVVLPPLWTDPELDAEQTEKVERTRTVALARDLAYLDIGQPLLAGGTSDDAATAFADAWQESDLGAQNPG